VLNLHLNNINKVWYNHITKSEEHLTTMVTVNLYIYHLLLLNTEMINPSKNNYYNILKKFNSIKHLKDIKLTIEIIYKIFYKNKLLFSIF